MKILLCHNYYKRPGGEDRSFQVEADLLKSFGHHVIQYTTHNNTIRKSNAWKVSYKAIWNHHVYTHLRKLIRREKVQIMHCTNTFPLISPAAYYAAKAEGIAVIQSLRNYRIICPNSYFQKKQNIHMQTLLKKLKLKDNSAIESTPNTVKSVGRIYLMKPNTLLTYCF